MVYRGHATRADMPDHAAGKGAPLKQDTPAQPLHLNSETCLYESKIDLQPVAKAARSQCVMGTTMALCGLAGVLVGSPTAPPFAKALVVMGAMASTYKHVVLARKELGNIAMRHVEQLVLKPTCSADEVGGSSSMKGKAEEQLEATQKLELTVYTPNLEMRFELGEPVAPWEGARYSGLVADKRPPFSEVCKAMFHFEDASTEPDSAVIPDPELFAALLKCEKVVVEREVVIRSHLEPDDLLAVPQDTKQHCEGLLDGVGSSEPGSAANNQRAAGRRKPPASEIQIIGRQAIVSGVIFQMAGLFFLSRLIADGKDQTYGEMYQQWKTASARE